MTCGVETRPDAAKIAHMMRKAEMLTIKTINGKIQKDCIRNEDLLKHTGIQDKREWIRKRKKAWKEPE